MNSNKYVFEGSGNKLANRMIGGGVAAIIVGGLIWFFASRSIDSYSGTGSLTVVAFGAALGQIGILVAALGLHALAVRAPKV